MFSKEKLDGLVKTEVSCNRGELTLRGVLYEKADETGSVAGGKSPAVIIMHGFMGNYKTVLQYGRLLGGMGYKAFCFDFAGGGPQSASDGSFSEMTILTEKEDLLAILAYVRSLPTVDAEHVTLMGCSQGGFVSSLVAAQEKEKVERLVMFYPALCIPEDAMTGKMVFFKFDPKNIPDVIKGPFGMRLGGCYVRAALGFDIYGQMAGYTGKVLLVHGTNDKLVNIRYSDRAKAVYDKAGTSCEYHKIEGGTHGFNRKHDAIAMEYLKAFMAL